MPAKSESGWRRAATNRHPAISQGASFDTVAPVTLISVGGRVHLVPGGSAHADITIAGPLDGVVGLLLGRIDPAEAAERGVTHTGDVRRLRGLRPRGERLQTISTG